MWRRFSILLPLAASGCGSVLDPAPYDPRVTSFAPISADVRGGPSVNVTTCVSTTPALDQFDSLPHAAACLEALAIGYARNRIGAARQQVAFDLPIIGMGIAAIANPVFHGATAATTALGLGSAAAGGVRLYFGPQLRATTYLTASQSLYCAYGVATRMTPFTIADSSGKTPVAAAQTALRTALSANAGAAKSDTQTAVVWASAQTAAKDLTTAASTISAAPGSLQSFALSTMAGATSKIATGTLDLSTVLSQLKAAQSTAPGSPSAGSAAASSPAASPRAAGSTIASQLQDLIDATNAAEAVAKAVSDTWGTLSTCTAVYQ